MGVVKLQSKLNSAVQVGQVVTLFPPPLTTSKNPHQNLITFAQATFVLAHLSILGIYQLLLTQFWPNFKGGFLGPSLTDANCHSDICKRNICPGNICPYQNDLSCYWPNFDQVLRAQYFTSLVFLEILLPKFCLVNILCDLGNFLDLKFLRPKHFLDSNFFDLKYLLTQNFVEPVFFRIKEFWVHKYFVTNKIFLGLTFLSTNFLFKRNFFLVKLQSNFKLELTLFLSQEGHEQSLQNL